MRKILIVDDEPNIREVIREYSEFKGFNVTEAIDGMDAIEKVRKDDFDIIDNINNGIYVSEIASYNHDSSK